LKNDFSLKSKGCQNRAEYEMYAKKKKTMLNQVKNLFRIWFLGGIAILAFLGYVFYSLLWIFRVMQKQKKKSLFLMPLVLVILLTFCCGVWYLFLPLPVEHISVDIIIPRNATVRQVADSLRLHKVVTSKRALLLYLKITEMERKIQAGKASFRIGDGVINAAVHMTKAVMIERSVTIPEGLTIEQTARRIHEIFPAIDTTKFAAFCYDSVLIKKLKVNAPTLEGYLFPETYRFSETVTERDIIIKMVHSFESCYESLIPDSVLITKLSKSQLITIASIVEREATLASEQPRIAAVFHNRVRIGYPLGADPTVRYALKKFNGPLTVSDLNTSSPYNTRKYTGIPPGPICSPGKGALQAALAPMNTKDLYFVAKWNGSGAHDFSLTNEEHNRKKLLIRQQNQQRLKTKKDTVTPEVKSDK